MKLARARIAWLAIAFVAVATYGVAMEPSWFQGGKLVINCAVGKVVAADVAGVPQCLTLFHQLVAPNLGLVCNDPATNNTATLRSLLETGGTAAGKTLTVPSGCTLMLGTPGAGDSVADFASNTTVYCEDKTAGVVLARHYCSGGSAPGASCDGTGTDCPGGGSCVYDVGSSEFAPTSGQTYTVFGATAGTTAPALINCSIWTNQRSQNSPAVGGDGELYGYCSGGTLDTAACNSKCTSGTLPGWLCNSDADCPGSGTCGNRSHCATASPTPGTCRPWLYTQPGGASGPGFIHPIDWSNASGFRIENVTIYDLRTATIVANLGTGGYVRDLNTAAYSSTPNIFTSLSLLTNPAPVGGVDVRPLTLVEHSSAAGWRYAYRLFGGSGGGTNGPTVRDSVAGQFGGATESTWPGTVGFLFRGAGASALFNRFSGAFIGGMCEFNGGCNYPFFMGNDGDFVPGPLWQIMGPHNNVQHNRKAWGGYGAVISWGEMRGRCPAGSRSGLICLQGTGTNATYGCPSSACAAHSDFPGTGGGHCQVLNNFLHTDQTAFLGYFAIDQSKRCSAGNSGASIGFPCSVNGDCGTGGVCDGLGWPVCSVNNNTLYNVLGGGVAFNLDSPALATTFGGGMSGWSFVGNMATMNSGGTGFKFPSSSAMGSANLVEANLITGATTDYTQWDPAFGVLALRPSSDQDATAGTLTLTSTNTDFTGATLADYDNTYRRTQLTGCVQVNNVSTGARTYTVKLKLEGSAVATAVQLVPTGAGNSAQVCVTYLDTTSATARTATITAAVDSGTTNTISNRMLARQTMSAS